MLLSTTKAWRLVRLALLAAVLAGAHSGAALALSCVPGVSVGSSGFTLGCAAPTIWTVLEVNENMAQGAKVTFSGNSGTSLSSAGLQVGVAGGTITDKGSVSAYSGNILVTDGSAPSTQATTKNDVQVNANGTLKNSSSSYSLATDNALVMQARSDALASVTAIGTYLSGLLSGQYQSFTSGIANSNNPLTISATHTGLNVIQIGTTAANKNINLDNTTLTFNCAAGVNCANVQFLVEVTGSLTLNHGAQIKVAGTGLDATDVLFNIEGMSSQSDGAVTLDNSSKLYGIILDVGASGDDKIDHGSTVYGSVIGGGNITFDNASSVVNNSTAYQNCTSDQTAVLTCVIRTAPEPGTIALLTLALVGLLTARMRKRGKLFAILVRT